MVPSTSLSLKLCGSCHAFNFGVSFWKRNLKMGAFIKRLLNYKTIQVWSVEWGVQSSEESDSRAGGSRWCLLSLQCRGFYWPPGDWSRVWFRPLDASALGDDVCSATQRGYVYLNTHTPYQWRRLWASAWWSPVTQRCKTKCFRVFHQRRMFGVQTAADQLTLSQLCFTSWFQVPTFSWTRRVL